MLRSLSIREVQRQLDSLKKNRRLAESGEHFDPVEKPKILSPNLEDDVFDADNFFDEL